MPEWLVIALILVGVLVLLNVLMFGAWTIACFLLQDRDRED